MSRSTRIRNLLAQAYADEGAEISLHNGDPGTTGANDLVSTIPHVAITWGTPTGGIVISTQGIFDIPSGGASATHVGLWDGSGNYLDSFVNHVSWDDTTTYGVTVRYTA